MIERPAFNSREGRERVGYALGSHRYCGSTGSRGAATCITNPVSPNHKKQSARAD